ncbi:helicase-related protein [Paenarthrobacter aromaticivorans]|uniref:DEAD/DEAH box helicase n=1 Tax=Paenarthrobacter aromaticivorans TaxID=2849150 RepID=UPI003A805AAA
MSMDDLVYWGLKTGLNWLKESGAQRVLVRGELTRLEVEELEALDADVRQLPPGYSCGSLFTGVYGVYRKGRWEALVISGEGLERPNATARHRFTADGGMRHLAEAREDLIDQWEDGLPFVGTSSFTPDDVVKVLGRDRVGRVRRVIRTRAGYVVEVSLDGELRQVAPESLQKVDGDPRDPAFWVTSVPSSAQEIAMTLTWTKLREPLSNTLYSYRATKTVFRAYQFIPALKILNSPTGRLLIADEVGLGKTIEAGLVWSELEQRSPLRRTLVVTPSSLTHKWRMEMSRRFDRDLEVIKPGKLADLAEDLLAGSDPELHAIISVESLRSASEVLEQLTRIRPRFDLVIVDEAHVLRNTGTRSNLLGGLLSDWADHLLFLSATPINLRSDDLYNLLTLLDDGMYQDSQIFHMQLEPNQHLNAIERGISHGSSGSTLRHHLRSIETLPFGHALASRPDYARLEELLDTAGPLEASQRAEVKRLVSELNTLSGVLSRTRKVDVPDVKAVREPHQVVVNWSADEKGFYDRVVDHFMSRAVAHGTPPGFAMQMPLRQVASCLPAMQARLSANADQFARSVEDYDEEYGEEDLAELRDDRSYFEWNGEDSKFEALLGQLVHLREQGLSQALIFSTFRGTIAYLAGRLSPDFRVKQLHGGIDMVDRQPIIDAFRDGKFDLLIASEVASEGLDFEFCNVLVNYDLPWNPMRVEQRIGRLDRFGQKHEKIFILNMHVPGTIESDILERLYTRIGVFRNSIGDLEPILRDDFRDLANLILDPRLDDLQRRQRAEEIATAIETRAANVRRLNEERAILSTIDEMQVEGLSESGPTEGRYVGATEVRSLIEHMLRATGGKLEQSERPGILLLRGTEELSNLIYRFRGTQGASRRSAMLLQGRISNGEPIAVTFDADLASTRDVELLSIRHPIVEVALHHLGQDRLRLHGYGMGRLTTLPFGTRYAVTVDLVESTGVRPTKELWATAIDIQTGAVASDIGVQLLEAVASGSLEEAKGTTPTPMEPFLISLNEVAWARHREEESRRRLENEALARARLDARKASLQVKIAKARATLAVVRERERDPRVVRMAEGRIRNLGQDLEQLEAELEEQRAFSMSRRTVALIELVGPTT